jgi:hypothetical protein
VSTGQSNGELREIADPAIDGDCAAMLLGHDVVADREAKACAFTSRLGRDEWLKEFVPNLGGNANTIIPYLHLDRIAEIPRQYL